MIQKFNNSKIQGFNSLGSVHAGTLFFGGFRLPVDAFSRRNGTKFFCGGFFRDEIASCKSG
jgi:hypothetical protein